MSIVNIFQLPEQPPKAATFVGKPFEFLSEVEQVIASHGMTIIHANPKDDLIIAEIDIVGDVLRYTFYRGDIVFINRDNKLVRYTEEGLKKSGYIMHAGELVHFYEDYV